MTRAVSLPNEARAFARQFIIVCETAHGKKLLPDVNPDGTLSLGPAIFPDADSAKATAAMLHLIPGKYVIREVSA